MSAEQDLANANVQIANLISEVTRFRDAAMGINNIWPTVTEGRNNTADGKYFSVPGSGAYLKLYRRAGTSQTLIAEFPDRAQVQGIVDTFAGRGVVGGSGDLIAQGAGGLFSLSGPTINDLYAERENGFYSTDAGTIGRPATGIGPVIQMNRVPTRKAFIALTDAAGGRMYFSAEGGSGFVPLREVYHNGNLLGTVSQSGGIPTGAVIERGSNANGRYVKLADGTLILYFPRQSVAVTTTEGGGYTSAEISMPYPLQPSSLVSNQGVGGSCSASGCFLAQKVLSSSIAVSVKSFTSVPTCLFDVCLIGSWL